MSFNLNKNGGSVPSKNSSFDLSKNDSEAPNDERATANPLRSRPGWPYLLLPLLIIGSAGWYFTHNTGDAKATAGTILVSPVNIADSTTKFNAGTAQPVAIDPKSGIASRTETTAEPHTAGNAPARTVARVAASFTTGSSHPGNIAEGLSALIRKKLKNNDRLMIHVLGYASSEGSPEINRQISQARADAYKRLLIQKGIAEANINAQGKGIENPVAGNDTQAGRKQNRRVEVSW